MGELSSRYEIAEATAESMRDTQGFLNQCCCCRRVRDSRDDQWRVLLAAMEHSLPATSHGYCATCLSTYYPIEEEEG